MGEKEEGKAAKDSPRFGSGTEVLKLKSGNLLLIDQFMLANQQFIGELKFGDKFSDYLKKVAVNWGGTLVSLPPGSYGVERDPVDSVILIKVSGDANQDSGVDVDGKSDLCREDYNVCGRVFVDTRCLVLIDAEAIEKEEQLVEYQEKRSQEGEKAARDYLRSLGAAVRYGFNRFGDELGVFLNKDKSSVALWPDIVENLPSN